jgi:hypothetical protein
MSFVAFIQADKLTSDTPFSPKIVIDVGDHRTNKETSNVADSVE